MNIYKFYTKRIFIFFPIVVLVILAISTLLFFYYPLYSKAEYWVPELYELKHEYAKKITDKKIIIASGSNSLFGINSYLLSEKTGYPTLNLAVFAGLPIEFLFYKIKEYAKHGDIVLLPLEFDYYTRDEKTTNWMIENFSTWGRQYLDIFSKKVYYEIVIKSILSYLKRIPYFGRKMPVRPWEEIQNNAHRPFLTKKVFSADHCSLSGEYIVDLPILDKIKTIKPDYIGNATISNNFIKLLNNFSNELAKDGIKVYITYPCSIKNENFDLDNKEHLEKLNNFYSKIQSSGINILGTPQLYNMQRMNFYDTNYHLNAKGNILRTLYLADDFNATINNKKTLLVNQDYFLQKEHEADKILSEYRTHGYIAE